MTTNLELSQELRSVFAQSEDVAASLGQARTTAHLLLCFFMLTNRASEFLKDHEVTVERILDRIRERVQESPQLLERVMRSARQLAVDSRTAAHVTSIHVLYAICSTPDSVAYRLIAELQLDMGTFRSRALSTLLPEADDVAHTGDAAHGAWAELAPVAHVTSHVTVVAEKDAGPPRKQASGLREPSDVKRAKKRPAPNEETTRDLARRLRATAAPAIKPQPDLPLPPSVRRPEGAQPKTRPGIVSGSGEHRRVADVRRPAAAAPARADAPARDDAPAKRRFTARDVTLDPKRYPNLTQLGRNLSALALEGRLDRVVGREDQIEQLIDILNKRRANNPVLIGDAGVGKTSVVEGLAQRLLGVDGHEPPSGLAGRIIIELEATKMIAGTGVRGSFSDRIQKLRDEVRAADGHIIVFLDELHTWIGMGAGGDGNADGAGELKTALSRGEFPCIGATTFDEYHRYVESDPAFARRFQRVRVDEPTETQSIDIIEGLRATYEQHHGVTITRDAIEAAVRLTHRYLPERRLPDKAVSVLDQAGARAQRDPARVVDRDLVASVVARLAGVSVDKLLLGDKERFVGLGDLLANHVIGHANVIEQVSATLRRNYAGFVSGRPIGTFLFLGPTGVGKTEFAKAIARVLFEDEGCMTRLDMSEYMEPHSVARLVGSPPGYVGHHEGGQLTEAVRRRPYQLVLLDEIEKAHPDILNILIQLLDEGRLTDSRGRAVDFSNTVVVMTSNLGAEAAQGVPRTRRMGFGAERELDDESGGVTDRVLDAARAHFRPELWNRIQERLVFMPLTRDQVGAIARLQLDASSKRLFAERRIDFTYDDAVIAVLIDRGGFDPELGARPMRRAIERLVETPIADLILAGAARHGAHLRLTGRGGEIAVELVAAAS
ncbi:MAG: ATP-dependent Clp protease ATP-binding subunit [Myxococcales bacterium]|nr:ATP-dependent Clp protease ATP-binding subunit [Myxococcales bacterium]MCB9520587.1 ATP-dependent Clp protease ATP-binding subunit [Myxococcales bacterium]MCB9531510.1 ATP-dependent Clp protease ATP-binding subunit [Myxococcales bacterium]